MSLNTLGCERQNAVLDFLRENRAWLRVTCGATHLYVAFVRTLTCLTHSKGILEALLFTIYAGDGEGAANILDSPEASGNQRTSAGIVQESALGRARTAWPLVDSRVPARG
jgi:hypothetical protein